LDDLYQNTKETAFVHCGEIDELISIWAL